MDLFHTASGEEIDSINALTFRRVAKWIHWMKPIRSISPIGSRRQREFATLHSGSCRNRDAARAARSFGQRVFERRAQGFSIARELAMKIFGGRGDILILL